MKKMLQEMENPIPHNKSLRAEQGFGANIQRRIAGKGILPKQRAQSGRLALPIWKSLGTLVRSSKKLIELAPIIPAQSELGTIPQNYHIIAMEQRLQFPDPFDIDDRGAMDA